MGSAASVLCLEGLFRAEFGDFLTADPRAEVPPFAYGVKAVSYRGVRPAFLDGSAYGSASVRDMLAREDPDAVSRMVAFVDEQRVAELGGNGLQGLADLSGLDHYTFGLGPRLVTSLLDAGGEAFVPVNDRLEPVPADVATGVLVRPVVHVLALVRGERRRDGMVTVFPARKGQVRRVPGGVEIGLAPSTVENVAAGLVKPGRSPRPEAGIVLSGHRELVRRLDAMKVGDHATVYVTAEAGSGPEEYQATMHDAGVAVWRVVDGVVTAATLPAEPAGLRLVLPGGFDHTAFQEAFTRLVAGRPISSATAFAEDIKAGAGLVRTVMREWARVLEPVFAADPTSSARELWNAAVKGLDDLNSGRWDDNLGTMRTTSSGVAMTYNAALNRIDRVATGLVSGEPVVEAGVDGIGSDFTVNMMQFQGPGRPAQPARAMPQSIWDEGVQLSNSRRALLADLRDGLSIRDGHIGLRDQIVAQPSHQHLASYSAGGRLANTSAFLNAVGLLEYLDNARGRFRFGDPSIDGNQPGFFEQQVGHEPRAMKDVLTYLKYLEEAAAELSRPAMYREYWQSIASRLARLGAALSALIRRDDEVAGRERWLVGSREIYEKRGVLSGKRRTVIGKISGLLELPAGEFASTEPIALVETIQRLEDDTGENLAAGALVQRQQRFLEALMQLSGLDNRQLMNPDHRFWDEGGQARDGEIDDSRTVISYLRRVSVFFATYAPYSHDPGYWNTYAAGFDALKEEMKQAHAQVNALREKEDILHHDYRRVLAVGRQKLVDQIRTALRMPPGPFRATPTMREAARDGTAKPLHRNQARFLDALQRLGFLDGHRVQHTDHRSGNTGPDAHIYADANGHEVTDNLTVARYLRLLGEQRPDPFTGLADAWESAVKPLNELSRDEDEARAESLSPTESETTPVQAQTGPGTRRQSSHTLQQTGVNQFNLPHRGSFGAPGRRQVSPPPQPPAHQGFGQDFDEDLALQPESRRDWDTLEEWEEALRVHRQNPIATPFPVPTRRVVADSVVKYKSGTATPAQKNVRRPHLDVLLIRNDLSLDEFSLTRGGIAYNIRLVKKFLMNLEIYQIGQDLHRAKRGPEPEKPALSVPTVKDGLRRKWDEEKADNPYPPGKKWPLNRTQLVDFLEYVGLHPDSYKPFNKDGEGIVAIEAREIRFLGAGALASQQSLQGRAERRKWEPLVPPGREHRYPALAKFEKDLDEFYEDGLALQPTVDLPAIKDAFEILLSSQFPEAARSASKLKTLTKKAHGVPFLNYYNLELRDWSALQKNGGFAGFERRLNSNGMTDFKARLDSHRATRDTDFSEPPPVLSTRAVREGFAALGKPVPGQVGVEDGKFILREVFKVDPEAYAAVRASRSQAYSHFAPTGVRITFLDGPRLDSEDRYGRTYQEREFRTFAEWKDAVRSYIVARDFSSPAPRLQIGKIHEWAARIEGRPLESGREHEGADLEVLLAKAGASGYYTIGRDDQNDRVAILNPFLQWAQKYLRWKKWAKDPPSVYDYIRIDAMNLPMPELDHRLVSHGLPVLQSLGLVEVKRKNLSSNRITVRELAAASVFVGDAPNDWKRLTKSELTVGVERRAEAEPRLNSGGTVPLTIHMALLDDTVELESSGSRPVGAQQAQGDPRGVLVGPGSVPATFWKDLEQLRSWLERAADAGVENARSRARVLWRQLHDVERGQFVYRAVQSVLDADLNGEFAHAERLAGRTDFDVDLNPSGVNARELWDDASQLLAATSGSDSASSAKAILELATSKLGAALARAEQVAEAMNPHDDEDVAELAEARQRPEQKGSPTAAREMLDVLPISVLPHVAVRAPDTLDASSSSMLMEALQDQGYGRLSVADRVRRIKTAFLRSTEESFSPLDHAFLRVLDRLPDTPQKDEVRAQWSDLQADAANLTAVVGADRVEAVLGRYSELSVRLRDFASRHKVETALPRPVFVVAGLADVLANVQGQVQHKIADARLITAAFADVLRGGLFEYRMEKFRIRADYLRVRHELHKLEQYGEDLRGLYLAPGVDHAAGRELLDQFTARMERFTTKSTEFVAKAQTRIEWRAANLAVAAKDSKLQQQLTLWMNIVKAAGSAASVGLLPLGFNWAPATVTLATDFARVAVLHGVERVQTNRLRDDQSNDQIYAIHDGDPLTAARAQAQAFKDYFKLLLEGIEIGASVWPAWPLLQGTVNMIFNEAIDARLQQAERELNGQDRPTATPTLEGLWPAFLEEAKEKFSDAGAWKTITEAIKGSADAYGVTGSFASLLAKPLAEKLLDHLPLRAAPLVTGAELRKQIDGLGSLSADDTVRPRPTAAPPLQSDPFPRDMPRRDEFGRSVMSHRAADSDDRLFSVALDFYGSQVWGKLDRKGIFSPEHADRGSFVDEATVQKRVIGRNSYTEDGVEVHGTWHRPFRNPQMGQPSNDYLFVRDSDGGWEWFHEMSVPAHGETGHDNIHRTFLAHPDWIAEGDFLWHPPRNGQLIVPFNGDRPRLNQQVHQLAALTAHQILERLDDGPLASLPQWNMEAGAIGSRISGQVSDWKQRLGRSKHANPQADMDSLRRADNMHDEFFRLIDRQLEQQAIDRGIAADRVPSAHAFLATPIARGAGLTRSRAPGELIAAAERAAPQRHSDHYSLTASSDLGLVWVTNLGAAAHTRPQWLNQAERHLASAAIPQVGSPVAAPVPGRMMLTSQARNAAQTIAAEAVSEAWQFRVASPAVTDVELVDRLKTVLRPSADESADPSLDKSVSDLLSSLPDSADRSALTAAWDGAKEDARSLAPGAASIRAVLDSYAHVYAWLDQVTRESSIANPLPRPLAVVAGLADVMAVAWAQVERKVQDARFLAAGMHDLPGHKLFRDHPIDMAKSYVTYRRIVHEQHDLEEYAAKLRPLFGMTAESVADAEELLQQFPVAMEEFTRKSTHLSKDVQRDIEWLAARAAATAAETSLKQRIGLGMNFLNSGLSAMSMALAPTGWGWAPATTTFLTDLARTAVMRAVEDADAKRQQGDKSAAAIFAMHDDDPLTVAKAQYEFARTLFRLTLEAIEIGAHVYPAWPVISGTLIPAFDTFINARLKEAERLAAGKPKPSMADVLPTGWKGFIDEAKNRLSDAGVWKTITEGSKDAATPYGWVGSFAAQLIRPLLEAVLDAMPMKPATMVTGTELMSMVEKVGRLSTEGTMVSLPETAPPFPSEPIPSRLVGKLDRLGRQVRGYKSEGSDQQADHVALDFHGSLIWGKLDRAGNFVEGYLDPSSWLDDAVLQKRVLTKNSYIESGAVEVFGTWHLPFDSPEHPQLSYLFLRDSDGGADWFRAMGLTGGGKTSRNNVHSILSDEKHRDWVSTERFESNPRVPDGSILRFGSDNEPRLNLRTHQLIVHFVHRVIEKHQLNRRGGDTQEMPRMFLEAGAVGSKTIGYVSELKRKLGRSELANPQSEANSLQRAKNLKDHVVRLIDRQLKFQAAARNIPLDALPVADDLVAEPMSRGAGLDNSHADPAGLLGEARDLATHDRRDSVSLTDSSDLGLLWAENLETTVRTRPSWFDTALRNFARPDASGSNVYVIEPGAAARHAGFVAEVGAAAADHPDQVFFAVGRAERELDAASIRRVVRAVHLFASSQELLPPADRRVPVVVVNAGLDQRLREALSRAGLDVPIVHRVSAGLSVLWRVTRSGEVAVFKNLSGFNVDPAVGFAATSSFRAVEQVPAEWGPWLHTRSAAARQDVPAPVYTEENLQLVTRLAALMPGHRDMQMAKAEFTVARAGARPDLVHRIAAAAERHDAGDKGLHEHTGISIASEAYHAIATGDQTVGGLTVEQLNQVIDASAAEYTPGTPEADYAKFMQEVFTTLNHLEQNELTGEDLTKYLNAFYGRNQGRLHQDPAVRTAVRDTIGQRIEQRGPDLGGITKLSMQRFVERISDC